MIDDHHIMDDSDFLIKLEKPHDFHPGLSNKIQVEYSEGKGRYTIANDTIKAGEVSDFSKMILGLIGWKVEREFL